MPEIFYEDVTVGETETIGSYEVTAEEIVAFGERYDPQPFHVDPEAAAESIHGGLIASGWHTVAICMRLLVDGHLSGAASLGGLGCDEIRWPNPVRPGDVLSIEREVLSKRPSESHPDRGIVRTEVRGFDQSREEKAIVVPVGLYGRRDD